MYFYYVLIAPAPLKSKDLAVKLFCIAKPKTYYRLPVDKLNKCLYEYSGKASHV
jgi:hypothetical protein